LGTSPCVADMSPLPWPQIRRIAARVALTAGENKLQVHHRTTRVLLRPNNWSLTLAVPFWVGELLGADIRQEQWFETAIEAQALISVYVKAADDLLDGDSQKATNLAQGIPKLLSLLGEAHLRLLSVQSVSRAVALQYHRLLKQQCEATAWESTYRRRAGNGLSARVLCRLADKAAILRWSALFVPLWIGRSSTDGARTGAILREMFLVMQLIDDLLDFTRDALSGQPNAVLIASGCPPPNDSFHLARGCRSSVARVSSLARGRAERLRGSAPRGTYFEQLCAWLVTAVDEAQRRAILTSSAQALGAALEALFSSD
jgi:hypothetical protein